MEAALLEAEEAERKVIVVGGPAAFLVTLVVLEPVLVAASVTQTRTVLAPTARTRLSNRW